MDLNLKNITFIIVCFRSENVIYNCLNSLPKNSNKLIIENSRDINLKKDLETKYDNIEVILNDNLGMGTSNNIGILRSMGLTKNSILRIFFICGSLIGIIGTMIGLIIGVLFVNYIL